jgi:hypothetical protein
VKLTATYLNGVAVGPFVVSRISIPTTIVLADAQPLAKAIAVGLGLFSVALSPYPHVTARRSLTKLDQW